MKVVITGGNGQLGYALQKTQASFVSNTPLELIVLTRAHCDLTQPEAIIAALDKLSPDAIINAAAYTSVDKAESEPDLAQRVNADAVKTLANWCEQHQVPLLQVSTDFVFDGKKSSPYLPEDATNPLGVYGQTKRQGELNALQYCRSAYVVRTGWVYCEQGANFVKTILRLANEREQLGIIADQVGTPTYAIHLAQMLWQLLAQRPAQKIWHFSDAGVSSWYDFAVAIVAEANRLGLLSRAPQIKPITTQDYPTPAQRPAYSVLCKQNTWASLAVIPVHWRTALVTMLHALAH